MSTRCTGCGHPVALRDDDGRGLTCGCAALKQTPTACQARGHTHLHGVTMPESPHGRPLPSYVYGTDTSNGCDGCAACRRPLGADDGISAWGKRYCGSSCVIAHRTAAIGGECA